MKKIFLLSIAFTCLCVCLSYNINAQGVGINSSGSAADQSAGLDVSFLNKGLLTPRMTTAQRDAISNPAVGLIIFNLDCNTFNFNAGTPAAPNWATINSSNALIAGVSIATSPLGAICSGTSVIFTATPVTGVTPATYQWKVNGTNVGTNSPTYSTSSLNNGDVVTCVLTSTAPCVTGGSPATSNAITMTVNPSPPTPGVISGPNSVCPNATDQTYSIIAVPDATSYNWAVSSGTIITNSNTSITVTFSANPAGTITVSAVNSCGTSAPSTLSIIQNSICSPYTFNYTGSVQTFTVPVGVTSVNLDIYGAAGANRYSGDGGKGGRATGILAVTPGQVLNIYVGGQSKWNGGGDSRDVHIYGGDASDVRVGGTLLNNRVIVAGGGGGAAFKNSCCLTGGNGGGLTGDQGGSPSNAGGGYGGSQTSGGTYGGGGDSWGNAGTLGVGGDAIYEGAGGGGGYYGGGGGGSGYGGNNTWNGGGGGGGSSYIGGVSSGSTTSGIQSGVGQIIITWQ